MIFTISDKKLKFKNFLVKTAVIVFWIIIWEIISKIVGIEFLVPSVPKVALALYELVADLIFWQIAFTSIYRILAGFILGSIAGCILAVLTAKSKIVYEFFIPVLSIIKATPIVSFIILALVWIKGGNIPSFISFLMVLPIVWGNVYKGITQTDYKLLEMAKIYKLPGKIILKDIYLHSVLPYFGAAATTSMGLAWKAGIAAEVIATPGFSIGAKIYDSKIYLETPQLFAWSIVVIILSVILEKTVTKMLKYFVPAEGVIVKNKLASDFKSPFGEIEEIDNKKVNLEDEYIILKNVSAKYGEVEVLKDFNAVFPKTGCVSLFGVSGIGKTTLVNIVAGIKKPSEGFVEFKGKRPEKMSYVFQEDRLIPWISVLKNVEIVTCKNTSKAIKILDSLKLGDCAGKFPDQLSGGMKQRVNIARAFAFDAPVILLDEPFKGLDLKTKQIIIDMLIKQKKEKLLILISHDKNDINQLADSVIHFS